MKYKKLLDLINKHYGLRGVFISELAGMLNISYTHANRLTIAAGYKRTKKVKNVNLADFSNDKIVQYIVNKEIE